MSQISWAAHNTALREGVRRADALGLRQKETVYERILINYVLYDVLEPSDQCAYLNGTFCNLAFPIALNIGVVAGYPPTYPADEQDVQKLRGIFGFTWLYVGAIGPLGLSGLRPASPEIHLIDPSVGDNGF